MMEPPNIVSAEKPLWKLLKPLGYFLIMNGGYIKGFSENRRQKSLLILWSFVAAGIHMGSIVPIIIISWKLDFNIVQKWFDSVSLLLFNVTYVMLYRVAYSFRDFCFMGDCQEDQNDYAESSKRIKVVIVVVLCLFGINIVAFFSGLANPHFDYNAPIVFALLMKCGSARSIFLITIHAVVLIVAGKFESYNKALEHDIKSVRWRECQSLL